MLKIDGLNQFYGQAHTLRDVSLEVPAAACTVLMGRNGVGKTTLLQSLVGLVPARSGRITLDDRPLTGSAEERAARGIGYVPQGRQIFPMLSVEENLRVALAARRERRGGVPDRIYALFPVLRDMRRRRGGDLSGGQQQQLAIGRALVTEPSVLLLDEPTEGIQPSIVREIGTIVRRLVDERGLAVLLVEQKLPFAKRHGSRFAILDRGSIVARGDMDALDDDTVQRHLGV